MRTTRQSEGSPSEAGLMLDAEAALDYLLRRPDVADPASIFLFGRSLGGAPLLYIII